MKIGSPDSEPHEAFHTLVFSAAQNETGVQLTAEEENTEFVLVSSLLELIALNCLTALIVGRWRAA